MIPATEFDNCLFSIQTIKPERRGMPAGQAILASTPKWNLKLIVSEDHLCRALFPKGAPALCKLDFDCVDGTRVEVGARLIINPSDDGAFVFITAADLRAENARAAIFVDSETFTRQLVKKDEKPGHADAKLFIEDLIT